MPKNWKSPHDQGVSITLPAHRTCHHRTFRITCAQYEALIAESANQCMACARPAAKNTFGKLAIDHDHKIGRWAVRGLICSGCNALFRDGQQGPYWAMPYLADPWFEREAERLGLSIDVPDEPPRDRCFRDFDGHIWFYEDDCWQHMFSRSRRLAWQELFYEFGPWLVAVDPAEMPRTRGYKALLYRRKIRSLHRKGQP